MMRRGLLWAVAAGGLGLALPALAQDPVLTRAGSGARAAGMANAFVAVSDDGTAASWNPAGLAQLRKPELSLVHSTIGREPSWEGFRSVDGAHAFTTAQASYTLASPEFASLAVPRGRVGQARHVPARLATPLPAAGALEPRDRSVSRRAERRRG